jgi:malate dehydrogenase (oxaloacetate-decarboxylating)(NADP+)
MAYTPRAWRARASAIEAYTPIPEAAYRYTGKGNLVAVVSNGTAVLGTRQHRPARRQAGDGRQGGALQALRRHRRLRHRARRDRPEEIVRIVRALEPTFGGINLEDIKAPECFYIEERCAGRCPSRSSTTTSTAPPSSPPPRC